jgi:hypothetical protein
MVVKGLTRVSVNTSANTVNYESSGWNFEHYKHITNNSERGAVKRSN